MICRRTVFRSALGLVLLPVAATAAQETGELPELDPAPLDALAIGTPVAADDLVMYPGDPVDVWTQPWEIGTRAIEIGATILQRYEGTVDEGFALGMGEERRVFHSVLFVQNDYLANAFIGFQTSVADLAGQHTVKVLATYGGLHYSDKTWPNHSPILVAHQIIDPE